MTNVIADLQDIADNFGLTDEGSEVPNLQATVEPVENKMNFHVQMNGYTMGGFESAVIHAAARLLTDGRDFKKQIEAQAVSIALEKSNVALQVVLEDVLKITAYVRGKETITLAEAIGLEGRSYLTEAVDRSGNPFTDTWDSSNRQSRVQFLVGQFMHTHMKKEIEAAVNAEIKVLKDSLSQRLNTLLGEERARINEALQYTVNKTPR